MSFIEMVKNVDSRINETWNSIPLILVPRRSAILTDYLSSLNFTFLCKNLCN